MIHQQAQNNSSSGIRDKVVAKRDLAALWLLFARYMIRNPFSLEKMEYKTKQSLCFQQKESGCVYFHTSLATRIRVVT
ncbi:MAG: hypothetical protein CMM74_14915 [Rhodospirillaceae bacterium]|nr:hypothetical protein [Rhodospirillaceae bacterium]